MSDTDQIIRSSGNVFADLGLPNADEEMAKAKLALAILRRIESRGLTQMEVAALVGTDRAKISHLQRGKLSAVTYDHLVRMLRALGCDVEITVTASPPQESGQQGRITVAA